MTFGSIWLILSRQLKAKWGRILLASGGIMIGVWAITLTSGLSLGLQQTIVTAINSQPLAKEITIQKVEGNKTSFFELDGPPVFDGLTQNSLQDIKSKFPDIVAISPSASMSYVVRNPQNGSNYDCTTAQNEISTTSATTIKNLTAEDATNIKTKTNEIKQNCLSFQTQSGNFQDFYDSNKKNWLGQTTAPSAGEIVTCFKCGNIDFAKKLGANEPKDLIGKTITVEFNQAPEYLQKDQTYDVTNPPRNLQAILEVKPVQLKIVSVLDDRELGLGSTSETTFLNFNYFTDAIKQADPSIDTNEIGFLSGKIYVSDYTKLDSVITQLKDDTYLPTSIAQILIQSVTVIFQVLLYVLIAFGLIVLIASVFGIINVMAISVLERQKEIGILKSLGAKDGNIFSIFILESLILGVFGWILGTLLAIGFGNLVSLIFTKIVFSNSSWKQNLENVNITSFDPNFPWWLLGGTLLLAVFFTVISGVFPAINASKQNPVEVLRAE